MKAEMNEGRIKLNYNMGKILHNGESNGRIRQEARILGSEAERIEYGEIRRREFVKLKR